MNFVKAIGKRVGGDLYIHKSAINTLSTEHADTVSHCEALVKDKDIIWNVFRLSNDNVSLLNYADFDKEPFPNLLNSLRIDLFDNSLSRRNYKNASNPPILHRKELLVTPDYPRYLEFCKLTDRLEELGLFYDVHKIGFLQQWNSRLAQHEIELSDHKVVGWANTNENTVYRHRTAMIRYQLSQPVQLLVQYNLLAKGRSFFDYGCGRGDDVAALRSENILANGWDPYFASDQEKIEADVVNLGFVLNVVEDLHERREALEGAWKLTNKVMAIAVMSPNAASIKNTKPYGDGFLTSRGTFQKYYSQDEIRQFIKEVIKEEPVAINAGIFFVFKDKIVEQEYLLGRHESREKKSIIIRSTRQKPKKPSRKQEEILEREDLEPYLSALADEILQKGRSLKIEEISTEVKDALKSNRIALSKAENYVLENLLGPSALLESAESRKDDLRVYLALEAFSQRQAYRQLPKRLQTDFKYFWGSYSNAEMEARNLLFSVGDIEKLKAACEWVSDESLGYMLEGEQLQFHVSVLTKLPPILRCYVGCAQVLYGEMEDADLIKIHINTGKLTLQSFENFLDPLPEISRRIKIDMRSQRVRVFDYRGRERSYLFMKSLFIPEDFDNFSEQSEFDREVSKIKEFDFTSYGPDAELFDQYLRENKLKVSNYSLLSL